MNVHKIMKKVFRFLSFSFFHLKFFIILCCSFTSLGGRCFVPQSRYFWLVSWRNFLPHLFSLALKEDYRATACCFHPNLNCWPIVFVYICFKLTLKQKLCMVILMQKWNQSLILNRMCNVRKRTLVLNTKFILILFQQFWGGRRFKKTKKDSWKFLL